VFTPTEFLRIAEQLLEEPFGEMKGARVRTALGRVYYALYLLVRSEIARRHGVLLKHLHHGAVYTRLQSPRASEEVRLLGRDLQLMYTLRQKADYELDPDPSWNAQLQDAVGAAVLVQRAGELARALPRLDFSPVISLLDPGV
jgi:hypothetical protein